LLWLYHVTGDPVFYEYAHRFLNYQGGVATGISATSTSSGSPAALTNGIFWWDGWTAAASPVAVDIEIKSTTTLDEVALFVSGHVDNMAPFTLRGFTGGTPSGEATVGPNPKVVAQHATGGYNTTVFVFDVTGVSGDSFRLSFTGPERPGLREINLHFDQHGRLDAYYANLRTRFGDI
jgi:hypothetical protein